MSDDAILRILDKFADFVLNARESDDPKTLEQLTREQAAQQIRQYIETEIIGEDDGLVMAKDLADHWSLTESGINRVLENGKNLGKNELRAAQRKKLREPK